ncbi:Putative acetate transporter GPR1/FUN34/SatP family [Septoria linicola]|uniref:Acetate transporter GPR1/FUN34/SatP family n=1 Tax=Septoria linicola TaxID=215465 RepID=A0A9Q9B6L3_9PEZI|nr:Putative acetate transporter GPR1/FUN34/SatP family [Septoria linicola]
MTPELFERLYLQPPSKVKGDLRKTFGNPTPLALTGFVIALTPLACQLMGWRGSGGLGTATIGVYYFLGGPCMWVGGILEFFLGNTFSFVVFFFYGGILFGWAATLHPFYNASGAYTADGLYRSGLQEDSFWASLAFWPLAAGMVSLVFLVGAVRINAVFMMVFFSIALGFLLIAGAFWEQALGDAVLYDRLLQGGGGCWFVCSLCGWYLLFIQVVDSVGFKWKLPVGDLTKFWARREGRVEMVEASAV